MNELAEIISKNEEQIRAEIAALSDDEVLAEASALSITTVTDGLSA